MTIIKVLRPDRFVNSAMNLINKVLSEETLNQAQIDIDSIVENEITAKSPMLLVSAPGYDASYLID